MWSYWLKTSVAVVLVSLLAGCGGGGGGTGGNTTISGVVRMGSEPAPASVEAMDSKGTIVASGQTDANLKYNLSLPAGASFPIVVKAKAKAANGEIHEMKGAVLEGDSITLDITMDTTRITDAAFARGGLTKENIAGATAAFLMNSKGSGGGGGGGHGGH